MFFRKNLFLLLISALFLLTGGFLPAAELMKIDRRPRQYRFFRNKPPAEKEELFRKIKFLKTLPKEAFSQGDAPIDDKLMKAAEKAGKKLLAGSLAKSSYANIRYAKRRGFKVCLVKANHINEVITGLILEPDCLLLAPPLDLEKIQKELLDKRHRPRSVTKWKENFETSRKRAPGTEIRVLSYNLLAGSFYSARVLSPAEDRAKGIREVLKKLAPDFAGFQEMDEKWYSLLEKTVSPYKFTPQTPKKRFCGILYDARKYTFLEGGVIPYTKLHTHIRHLVYALFRDIKSGKKYLFCNTHWDLNVPKRMVNGKRMGEILQDLARKYPSIPILAAGDFNCNILSKEFALFTKISSFRDAVSSAPQSENTHLNSSFPPKYGLGPSIGKHVDHIVLSGEWKVLAGKMIIGKDLFFYSDHFPILADLALQ